MPPGVARTLRRRAVNLSERARRRRALLFLRGTGSGGKEGGDSEMGVGREEGKEVRFRLSREAEEDIFGKGVTDCFLW